MRRNVKASPAGSNYPGSRLGGMGIGLVVAALFVLGAVPSGALAAECPNEAIRQQQHTTRLPECRAYEMVSPVAKNGARIGSLSRGFNQMTGMRISVDGNAALFAASGALPGSTSSLFTYKAARSGAGWSSAPIALPVPAGEAIANPGVFSNASADLSTGLFAEIRSVSAEEFFLGTDSVFLHHLEPGGSTTLLNPGQSPGLFGVQPIGQSADLSHALFTSTTALTTNAPSGASSSLYDYTDGALHLVSILENGQPDPIGAVPGAPVPTGNDNRFNAVSDDGSHIAFTALSDNQVYQRIDGTETVEVSVSQGGADPTGAFPAKFVGATTTGSTVYFTSAAELTPDANTGEHTGRDLYAYDVASGELTDLTVDDDPGDTAGADVLGLAGLAEDGSRLYVVAKGVLAAGATAGQPNLYVLEPGRGTEFLATLTPGELGVGDSKVWEGGEGGGSGSGLTSGAQVTPNGRYLALTSEKQLTPDAVAGYNAYLYDSGTTVGPKLVCVSCGPGDPNDGNAQVTGFNTGSVNYYQPSYVLDDGTVFFISLAALVEGDTNGRYDVYEYHDGTVRLISSGRGNGKAEFVDATADGRNALVITANRLVAADRDQSEDLYDVRVEGGFSEPPAPPPCSGEGCRPLAVASPGAATPASTADQGNGQAADKGWFSVGRVSAQAVKTFARTGKLTLRVKTGETGTLAATATAPLGKRKVRVAQARKEVSKASTASLMLSLSRAARRQLAQTGRLRVRLSVTFSKAPKPSLSSLTLVSAKHNRKAR